MTEWKCAKFKWNLFLNSSLLLLNPILSDSFFLTLVLAHYAILLKCDEREKPGKESNRESSQVNRKWKENLRGKIKLKQNCNLEVKWTMAMELYEINRRLALSLSYHSGKYAGVNKPFISFMLWSNLSNYIRWHLYLPSRQHDDESLII